MTHWTGPLARRPARWQEAESCGGLALDGNTGRELNHIRLCERGHVDKANRVSQAWFTCRNCGFVDHADRNGSRNIRARARARELWRRGAPSTAPAPPREPGAGLDANAASHPVMPVARFTSRWKTRSGKPGSRRLQRITKRTYDRPGGSWDRGAILPWVCRRSSSRNTSRTRSSGQVRALGTSSSPRAATRAGSRRHDRARGRTFSVGSRPHSGRGLPVADRVDPLGPHAQLHCRLDVAVANPPPHSRITGHGHDPCRPDAERTRGARTPGTVRALG
ncbi:zinc ribbon domain-containing protein [Streptomyces mirabilis]|uniref:zinc ribbon domain-containing protein n=1 Tax=Streptomyces mirabilis TaxID=68239 RepID=UPI0036DB4155